MVQDRSIQLTDCWQASIQDTICCSSSHCDSKSFTLSACGWVNMSYLFLRDQALTQHRSITVCIYKNTCNECMCVCVCVCACARMYVRTICLTVSLKLSECKYLSVRVCTCIHYKTKHRQAHTHTSAHTHTEIMPPTLNTNALEAFMGLTSALCRSCRSKNLMSHCWMTICAIQTPHQCQHADASWLTSVSFWGLAKDRVCAIGFVKLGYHSRKLTREVKVHVLLPGDLKDWRHPQTSPDPSEHWWRRKWIWLLRWWNEV